MLKYAVTITVFVLGAALPTLSVAQAPYDNEQIAKIKREVDQRRTPDQLPAAPAPQYPAAPAPQYPAAQLRAQTR